MERNIYFASTWNRTPIPLPPTHKCIKGTDTAIFYKIITSWDSFFGGGGSFVRLNPKFKYLQGTDEFPPIADVLFISRIVSSPNHLHLFFSSTLLSSYCRKSVNNMLRKGLWGRQLLYFNHHQFSILFLFLFFFGFYCYQSTFQMYGIIHTCALFYAGHDLILRGFVST